MTRNALLCLTMLFAAGGCGGEVSFFDADDDGGAGGQDPVPGPGPGPGPDPTPSCDLPEPGPTFTFRIRNVGPRWLQLNYGWGGDTPIRLLTDRGFAEISSWAEPGCGTSCRETYDGFPGGCGFGGPGSGENLAPGGTATIAWDRLTYTLETPNPRCITSDEVPEWVECALPRATPFEVTEGILSVCIPNPDFGDDEPGWCSGGDTFDVPFAADLGLNDVVIEVE
ncbi:MAG: hypothetical protein AAGN82_22470 [Myxococcota bacterium]